MSNVPATTAKEKMTALMRVIESKKDAFQELLPKYLTTERLFRIAQLALSKQPLLLQCTPASVLLSLMDAARAGLEPDGQNAALIPYGNQCQFQPMWQGLVRKAIGDGAAKKIEARLVYENDFFRLWYDPEPHLEHEPARFDEGEVIGAYAYAVLPDGGLQVEYMNKRKLDHVRAKARAKGGAWQTDEEEMYRKTPTKRLFKYLAVGERTEYAIAVDAEAETGKPRVDIPLLETPPDLVEPKPTATETLAEKTRRPGRPRKEGNQPIVNPIPPPESPTTGFSEVQNFEQLENKAVISQETLDALDLAAMEKNYDGAMILRYFGAESLEQLTEKQGRVALTMIEAGSSFA